MSKSELEWIWLGSDQALGAMERQEIHLNYNSIFMQLIWSDNMFHPGWASSGQSQVKQGMVTLHSHKINAQTIQVFIAMGFHFYPRLLEVSREPGCRLPVGGIPFTFKVTYTNRLRKASKSHSQFNKVGQGCNWLHNH